MKSIKYISLNIITFIILIIIWFFSCFLLGFASNSTEHQRSIWILYLITVVIHFIINYIIYLKFFTSINTIFIILSFTMYVLTAWYFYNYS